MALIFAASISDQIRSVRKACALAGAGQEKVTALRHLHVAEKAHAERRHVLCAKELAAAAVALG